MNKDYYVILGLGKDATEEQIKKAYKRKALQFHPDKNKEPDSEEKFKEIAEAYEVLSDGDKKSIFDEYGVEGLNRKGGKSGSYFRSKSAFDPSDPMDLFKTFFGEHDPFAGILTSIFNQHAHHANFNFGSNQFCKVKNASLSKDHVKDDPAATTSYEEQIGDGGTVQMTKTIIGGDGRVRRDMRFRTQSAGTKEDAGRKDDGSLSLGRQHSAPTGHVSTSTPVRLHRPNIRQGNNSSGKEKETSTAEIILKTTKPLKSSNKIKIIRIKTAEPQTAETCQHGDKIVTIPETKITITLKT